MDYVFVTPRLPGSRKFTSCTALYGADDVVDLSDPVFAGESLAEHWPDQAHTLTTPALKGTQLAAAVGWYEPLILCSEELSNVLVESLGAGIESYPVQVRARDSGDILADDYRAVHVRAVYPAVDFDASNIKFTSRDPAKIHHFRECVLDFSAVPSECKVFRLAERPAAILIRTDIAGSLADFTGLAMTPASEFSR